MVSGKEGNASRIEDAKSKPIEPHPRICRGSMKGRVAFPLFMAVVKRPMKGRVAFPLFMSAIKRRRLMVTSSSSISASFARFELRHCGRRNECSLCRLDIFRTLFW